MGPLCRAEPGARPGSRRERRTGRIRACARHLAGRDDGLVKVKPLIDRAPRFADLIEGEPDAVAFALIRRSEPIGRPLGSAAFVAAIERSLGRALAPGKGGGNRARRARQALRKRRSCHVWTAPLGQGLL